MSDYSDVFVMKHSVQRINVIGETKIKLVTGDPLKDITIPYQSIVQPVTESIYELVYIIIAWIEECVCCGEDPPV